MAKQKQGTRRNADEIVGAVLWSECESGAITLHDDNPRVGGTSLTGDDVRVLVAEVQRLRADVARLTQERDEARGFRRAESNADATLKAQRDDCHERRAEAERRAEQAEQRLEAERREWWRRRDVDVPCEKCHGAGSLIYANTSTWRGGVGGNAMRRDVCDRCWGSGEQGQPWMSHREAAWLRETLEEVRQLIRDLPAPDNDSSVAVGERHHFEYLAGRVIDAALAPEQEAPHGD